MCLSISFASTSHTTLLKDNKYARPANYNVQIPSYYMDLFFTGFIEIHHADCIFTEMTDFPLNSVISCLI